MWELDKERIFHFFNEISKIPRGSGNEKAVSDWILSWARDKGLDVVQDEDFDLVIKKNGFSGYENVRPVILQAHMDMVCEKEPNSKHDFLKDPIELKIEDDWIMSNCGTSLGADNGIGVAAAMAVLDDETLKHPPLEVIFTVEEESTFKGAIDVSPTLFSANRMINLDHAADDEVIAASCGGIGAMFKLPIVHETSIPEKMTAHHITISGLVGGHSGEDIHRGRGNAIEIMGRLVEQLDCPLVSFKGGTYRLAIPREAEAIVLTDNVKTLEQRVSEIGEILKKELSVAGTDMSIKIEECEADVPLTKGSREKLVNAIKLYPNGVLDMSSRFEGVVESSNNLGIVEIVGDELIITSESRGMTTSAIEYTSSKIRGLASMLGGNVNFFDGYSPWEYASHSELRDTVKAVYSSMFGGEMKELVVHAGLECGSFIDKVANMEAIAIGPNCQSFHSPNEKLSVSSTRRFYKLLTGILENLKS